MGSQMKVKVVAKGKRAKDLAATLAGMPDSSGSNFVSRNDLHVPPVASSGVSHSSQHVPYKSRPGWQGNSSPTPELVGNEHEQVAHPGTGSRSMSIAPGKFGPSCVGEDIDTVKPVMRDMNPVERARQENNRTRDMRTNHGRGKPAVPEVD